MFERLFRSLFWKAAVITLLALLVVAVAYLFVTAHYSIEYFMGLGRQGGYSTVVDVIDEVYMWGLVAILLLALIVIAGVFDLISFVFLTRRYRAIAASIRAFADGDMERRVAVPLNGGGDDVIRLGRAFNQMADVIAAHVEELRKNDRVRRELVANVAHDLGTPVTSIHGFAETILIKEGELSAEEHRRYMQVILSNTDILMKLVNELFELSKLDEMKIDARQESFSIVTLTSDVASRFIPMVDAAGVSLSVDPCGELPLVYADLGLIERVLSNVIENAVRYTREGGSISISFFQSNGSVGVSIKDTGIGIPAEDLPRVFDRFFRVNKDRSRDTGGAGLGLAITKEVIEVHGGSIDMKSELGVGSELRFTLPAADSQIKV